MPKSSLLYKNIADVKKFDGYVIDTNVWLDLNGPFVDPHDLRTIEFSSLLKKISNEALPIVVPTLVVEEFCHAYLKLVHQDYCRSVQSLKLKEYRSTDDYKSHANTLSSEVDDLLTAYKFVNPDFSADDLRSAVAAIEKTQCDLNDYLLAQFSSKNRFIVITGDTDFLNLNIPTITFKR